MKMKMSEKHAAPSHGVQGFTLIELLVVIAILSLIAAILFPVFSRVRESGRATSCLSNMKQLGTAIHIYLQDYDETYPMNRLPDSLHQPGGCITPGDSFPEGHLWGSSRNWKREIASYVTNAAVFQCPSNSYAWSMTGYAARVKVPGDETNFYYPKKEHLPASYAYNGSFFHEAVPPCWYGEKLERPRRLSEIQEPSRLILLLESRYSFPGLGSWMVPSRVTATEDGPLQSHNGACNFLFADQHARRMKVQQTCTDKMWTDGFSAKIDGCKNLSNLAAEYR